MARIADLLAAGRTFSFEFFPPKDDSEHAALAEALLDLLAPLPQPLVAGAVRLVDHQPLINLIVTNVPGPPFPLYVLGARMLEAYPFVPVAGNLTLGVAVLSYDGTLSLGILADAATCPDAAAFGLALETELAALTEASPPRRRHEIA